MQQTLCVQQTLGMEQTLCINCGKETGCGGQAAASKFKGREGRVCGLVCCTLVVVLLMFMCNVCNRLYV